jgi:endonuclease/exonuclease/phosphatase family metal-dependent hydrolase
MTGNSRRWRVSVVLLAVLVVVPSVVGAEAIKVATWNIEHLRDEVGEGPNRRDLEDFARLKRYAEILDADVVAFQEVETIRAAERVFDPATYQIFIENRNDKLHTGFAVRRGIPAVQNPDYRELNVTGGLRHGTDITISVSGREIRLLSIHLKSGCWGNPMHTASRACRIMRRQLPALEAWIDARAEEGVPFIVLGDFNRRFDTPGDTFWPEIDDGKPLNADLYRITEGEYQLCWGREFPRFIDHIVFDKLSTRWIVPFSFEQIVYQQDAGFKEKLSDHCPIGVVVEVR